jgi:hypothetical protein
LIPNDFSMISDDFAGLQQILSLLAGTSGARA